ncbi:MAG TPA: PrsW family glutamic-type intramembrane protease, partial [Anaerolineales bacterium]|nr:PrsW family glutamic-type intramembrane protease [Anaerolineales bacterium]
MKTSQNNLSSLLASILFILGALFLFGISLIMAVTALASFFTAAEVSPEQTILFAAFAFEGIVLAIAAFFSIQKYLRKPAMDQRVSLPLTNGWIILFVLIAAASLLIGYPVSGIKSIDWLILPVLTIPAIVFPLAVLLSLGTRKLPFGTRWETWSVLGIAMTLSPLLLLFMEVVVAIILFFIIVAYLLTQPQLVSELQGLSRQIMILGPQSEAARELLAPVLTKLGAIVSVLIYIAILVPAIEEVFKPLGVWLFVSKLESAAQGFTLGALSGAGYALIETIGVSGQQTGEWTSVLFSRIGTGLLHITTSALMGAAIVLAWRERRYLRLVGTYLLAMLLHG